MLVLILVAYHNELLVSKEMSKVNVEQIARCSDHDIIIVAISNTL